MADLGDKAVLERRGSQADAGGRASGRNHSRGVIGKGDKKEQLVGKEESPGSKGGRPWG